MCCGRNERVQLPVPLCFASGIRHACPAHKVPCQVSMSLIRQSSEQAEVFASLTSGSGELGCGVERGVAALVTHAQLAVGRSSMHMCAMTVTFPWRL